MKLIKDMNEPELRDYSISLARIVEDKLPPGPSSKGKALFFLILTDDEGPGISQYVSNVQRSDAIKMLRETADRLHNADVRATASVICGSYRKGHSKQTTTDTYLRN